MLTTFLISGLQTTSSALKGAIQLGITHTVGSLSQKAERDVLMQDFVVVESIFFPGLVMEYRPRGPGKQCLILLVHGLPVLSFPVRAVT